MNLYFIIIFSAIGVAVGYVLRHLLLIFRANSLEAKLRVKLDESKKQSQEIILDAKNQALKILEDAKNEEKEHKKQLTALEERLLKREENLDQKDKELNERNNKLNEAAEKIKQIKAEIDELKNKETEKLEKISGFTMAQAREELMNEFQRQHAEDLAESLKKLESERKQEIERRAQELVTSIIERYARSGVSEITTSVVDIPDEEVKGKIIGKEGRNIRHLERLTGVDVIIDETPGVVTLSSFDPVRRATAKLALEKLIKDGRIQPAKIEEKVQEAQEEIQEQIKKAGEEAAYSLNIFDLPPQIIHLMGRLKFRTSFGQNVLSHSVDVANVATMLAQELGLNAEIAKKGAFLHDIGKSVDHEIEGSHLEIGRKILQKYGIDERIIKAMQSHHETYPIEIPEAFVVNAADAISASRPGARRDTIENYLKRLGDLEKIATAFEGVEKAYAISGGREIRIFVFPDKIDDLTALQLARDIAKKVEQELKYPGEIKVNVIRETRAVEYAR